MNHRCMRIRVVLHAGLPIGAGGEADEAVAVDEGTTLAAVLTGLGVDLGLVGVASSGGRLMPLESELEADCTVDVYPLVGGG